MKKNFFYFFAIATFSFALQSCDKCKDINCQNGGTCDKGKCTCPTGYSGDNCEIKDPCLGISCLNGGTCASGSCNCPSGYEGIDCGTESRGKFLGNFYSYKQWGCNQISQYNCTISASSSGINKISISNFNNKGWSVLADVSSSSFIISAQNFTDAGTGKSWKVETTAGASLTGNTLTIPVKFTDNTSLNTINCAQFILYK